MSTALAESLDRYLKATDDSYRPIMFLPQEGGIIIGVSMERADGALSLPCQIRQIGKYLYGQNDRGVYFVFRIEEPTLLGLIRNAVRTENPDIAVWVMGRSPEETGFVKEVSLAVS